MTKPVPGAPTLSRNQSPIALPGASIQISAAPAPGTLCGPSGCRYEWSAPGGCGGGGGAEIAPPMNSNGPVISLAVQVAARRGDVDGGVDEPVDMGGYISVLGMPAGVVANCSLSVTVVDRFGGVSSVKSIVVQVRLWRR